LHQWLVLVPIFLISDPDTADPNANETGVGLDSIAMAKLHARCWGRLSHGRQLPVLARGQ